MKIRKYLLLFLALMSLGLSGAVFAAAPDFSTVTTAVDFSTVNSSLISVFAAVAGVAVVFAGGSFIVSKLFRGGR